MGNDPSRYTCAIHYATGSFTHKLVKWNYLFKIIYYKILCILRQDMKSAIFVLARRLKH